MKDFFIKLWWYVKLVFLDYTGNRNDDKQNYYQIHNYTPETEYIIHQIEYLVLHIKVKRYIPEICNARYNEFKQSILDVEDIDVLYLLAGYLAIYEAYKRSLGSNVDIVIPNDWYAYGKRNLKRYKRA